MFRLNRAAMQTDTQRNIKLATWAHAAPFGAWLFLMFLLAEPSAWEYALRSLVSLALLLYLKPWRWYGPLQWRHIPLALVVGVVVCAFWILPESAAVPASARDVYLRWLVLPMGRLPDPTIASPYDPGVCGWPLTVVRLLGSAMVIGVVEEFFWRGFLYRWLLGRNFLEVDLSRFHLGLFVLVSVVFGLEHHRWLVGMLAGACYAGLLIRTRDIWAVAWAHAVTNFLLGIYVLRTGSYAFW